MPIPAILGTLLLEKKKVFNYADSKHADLSPPKPKALPPLAEHVATSPIYLSENLDQVQAMQL